ncbi:MarR family transcriptional regulator [Tolypothrix tenuis PCC 7101]|uniref:MarR family transcriptional regulator n=1 Tax=Tolypothrix tenuis PCC 7101 TaxID=231146 RepID=A0A1Z4N8K1_9CYAN|nr:MULTISPECIES: MarR family transcriptional regulator [unclassified Tolypothrix]MBD2241781.1 MarR family transcriptional regulator [Aulosira sp. FACHB-113]BAY34884.1 MarR family transcriptional regulator [Nostoc carneum NIES-2107]BAY91873.1 MarR family transcriptional regulator [Microchaete diplosiphon NIES-3275]BAZ02058.1 MarR family transcriptional regulator [Tolypothrix tenuis PCC 7101]BAZ74019.1 MarR family transcriptional regulator [Aulosira laxa NIES-50]
MPKLGKPTEECAARVMETVPLLMRFIRADMRSHNAESLSIPQLRSLAFLNRNPGASLSEVAEHLGVTCATASTTIERLVQRDLVQRTDHPQERRRIVLNLTESGKFLLLQSQATTRAHIADILDGLTPEQISQIEAGLTLLKNVFEQTEVKKAP